MRSPILIIACILGWVLIIGLPVLLSVWLSRSQYRRNFLGIVRALNGTVVSRNRESIVVQLPVGPRVVSGAFFPGGDHWFGREVLELHFPLPVTSAQLFICCECPHTRSLPEGWQRLQDSKVDGVMGVVSATATPESAAPIFGLGIGGVFEQLRRMKRENRCRIAIDNQILIVMVAGYMNTVSELSKLLSFGSQLTQQIAAFEEGAISLAETIETADSEKSCPICSSPVINAVRCGRCHTPHCRECWEYNGKICGVFACGGKNAD